MRKKIFTITLAIFMLAFCALTCVACNDGNKPVVTEFEMPVGSKPTLANRISQSDLDVINAGLAEGAPEDAKKSAVIKLYDIANSSRIEQNDSLMVQESLMGVNPFSSDADLKITDSHMGLVTMHGFTLRSGNSWYNEFAAQAKSDSGLGDMFMRAMSTMVKVNYHLEEEPDDYYFVMLTDSSLETDCNVAQFPYSSYRMIEAPKRYDYEDFMYQMHLLAAPNEIYNMDFMTDIIADGATITHEDGIYKVHFSVDPKADKAKLEQWYRLPQEDMQAGNNSIKAYLRYVCDLEVWDNGYAKCYNADYMRDAGVASSVTVDHFNYLWNKDEIDEIISNDYRLEELSDFEKLVKFRTYDDYISYYIDKDIVARKIDPLYIVLIVVAGVIGLALIALIIVAILLKCGKLPKLAAKLKAKKERKATKKKLRKARKQGFFKEQSDGEETDDDDDYIDDDYDEEDDEYDEEQDYVHLCDDDDEEEQDDDYMDDDYMDEQDDEIIDDSDFDYMDGSDDDDRD